MVLSLRRLDLRYVHIYTYVKLGSRSQSRLSLFGHVTVVARRDASLMHICSINKYIFFVSLYRFQNCDSLRD